MARIGFLACMTVGLCTSVAAAPLHRHHLHHYTAAAPGLAGDASPARTSQEPYGGGSYNPYAGYAGPGSAVLNATVRAAREPGVTLELAPDAKETATGGPVGGPPGFDGS